LDIPSYTNRKDRVKSGHYIRNVNKRSTTPRQTANNDRYHKAVLLSCVMMWRTYPRGAVLCLWQPATHPLWGSSLSACSVVELPSPLRSDRSPSCVLPPWRTWRRLFSYTGPKNTPLPHLIAERYRGFLFPLLQSRLAKTDSSRFLPHWTTTRRHTVEHLQITGRTGQTSLLLLRKLMTQLPVNSWVAAYL